MKRLLKIGHFSDVHGRVDALISGIDDHRKNNSDPDLWICTGDFFGNVTRGVVSAEKEYQHRWLHTPLQDGSVIVRLIEALAPIPLLWVPGNHDYINLSWELANMGYPAYEVTPEGVDLMNLKFSGFRQINYIVGEWAGESHSDQLAALVSRTWNSNPDILVTHAPPSGILDSTKGYGIVSLSNAYAYKDHKIQAHFFGHCHEDGGKEVEVMGVRFFNNACRLKFIDLEVQ